MKTILIPIIVIILVPIIVASVVAFFMHKCSMDTCKNCHMKLCDSCLKRIKQVFATIIVVGLMLGIAISAHITIIEAAFVFAGAFLASSFVIVFAWVSVHDLNIKYKRKLLKAWVLLFAAIYMVVESMFWYECHIVELGNLLH